MGHYWLTIFNPFYHSIVLPLIIRLILNSRKPSVAIYSNPIRCYKQYSQKVHWLAEILYNRIFKPVFWWKLSAAFYRDLSINRVIPSTLRIINIEYNEWIKQDVASAHFLVGRSVEWQRRKTSLIYWSYLIELFFKLEKS